jgi:hypothetical protein
VIYYNKNMQKKGFLVSKGGKLESFFVSLCHAVKSSFFFALKSFRFFLMGLFFVSIIICTSFSFMKTPCSECDAYTQQLSSYCSTSDNGFLYFSFSSKTKPSSEKKIEVLDSSYSLESTLSKGISWATLGTEGNQLHCQISFLNASFYVQQAFSLVTLKTFSNGKKMESLNLELLKALGRDVELVHPSNSDGIVYIPDYLADGLIENGNYHSYDDILQNESLLQIKTAEGKRRVYRVANIFHSKGFNHLSSGEQYLGSDSNFGFVMFSFLDDFLVICDLGANKLSDESDVFVSALSSRGEFSYQQMGASLMSSKEKNFYSSRVFRLFQGRSDEVSLSRSLEDFYYQDSQYYFGGLSWGLISCLTLVIIFSFLFILFLFKKGLSFRYYGVLGLPLLLYVFVVSLMRQFLKTSFLFLSLFNVYGNVLFVIYLLTFLVFGWLSMFKRRNGLCL